MSLTLGIRGNPSVGVSPYWVGFRYCGRCGEWCIGDKCPDCHNITRRHAKFRHEGRA